MCPATIVAVTLVCSILLFASAAHIGAADNRLPLAVPRTVVPRTVVSAQCGWPYVGQGGLFTPPVVRFAQFLLSAALDRNLTITGTYDAATKKAIEDFQSAHGLTPDGVLGPVTWPVLAKNVAPLRRGGEGPAVLGLQHALAANGYPVAITGRFGSETAGVLKTFQIWRGDASNGEEIEASSKTLQLLVTRCNATGMFWFDAGWPQGSMSLETLSCLRQQGPFHFATFECWVEVGPGTFWSECVGNIARAWAAGFDAVGVYMFAQRYSDPSVQVRQLLANLTENNVTFNSIMLDIEGTKWSQYSHAENRAFLLALRSALEMANIRVTIYAGREWPDFFGENFTAFSDLPLIYAHYDNVPSFYDFVPYGGWILPAGKQFWDGGGGEAICGTGDLDWDWSERPFW